MIIRPMLAATVDDLAKLQFPLLATPKIDGIRCCVVEGQAVSRNLKPIPNDYIRTLVSKLPEGFDGELVCPGGFNKTQSMVMARHGTPAFCYRVFDWESEDGYMGRIGALRFQLKHTPCGFAEAVLPDPVENVEELQEIERLALMEGYEGLCLRSPNGPYKAGRSTLKEQYLMKLKRFKDSEAIIVGFEELEINDNKQTEDAFGLAKRSSHKYGMRPGGTLGSLWVQDVHTGLRFNIGSGFTSDLRASIWTHQDKWLGKHVSYKFQPSGMKDVPRFPIYKSRRIDLD